MIIYYYVVNVILKKLHAKKEAFLRLALPPLKVDADAAAAAAADADGRVGI